MGTIYGQEISNEIHNQTAFIIVRTIYDQDFLDKQVINEGQREASFKCIQDAKKLKKEILQVDLTNDQDVDIILSELQNKMADKLDKHDEPIQILLFGDNKDKHEGK